MKELLISQIAPIVATAIVAILVAIIKQVVGVAIELFVKKKEEIEQRIIVSGHESELTIAKEVWNIIEEKFRITENAKQILDSKANEFDKLLLQRIPGLTQTNLDDLRQAIAGEVNRGKKAIVSSSTVIEDTSSQQLVLLQETNTKLQADNADLKAKLDQINSTLNSISVTTEITV